jgi:hypothetical protein
MPPSMPLTELITLTLVPSVLGRKEGEVKLHIDIQFS